LLVDSTGRAITTPDAWRWRRRRAGLEQAWREEPGSPDLERTRPPHLAVPEQDRIAKSSASACGT
jgi:hypothetical protein